MAMIRASHLILLLAFLSLLGFCSAGKAEDEKKAKDQEKAIKELKESKKNCTQKSSESAVAECLKSQKQAALKLAEKIYPNATKEMREKREKKAEKEASIEALGEKFAACMATATNDSGKKACKESLKKQKDERKLEESEDDILSRLQMSAAIEAGTSCNSTKKDTCLKAAKENMKKLGMAVRKYAKMKRLAEVKAAAEAWASCKDAGNTDAACKDIAKTRFEEVSGASNAWTSALEAQVQKLGQALYNGEEIKFTKLKMIQVDTFTTSTNCSDVEANKILVELIKKVNATGKAYETILAVGCRLVQGLAEHQFHVKTPKLDDTTIDLVSEQISTTLNGTINRRLTLSRRLAAITETNADVAVQLDSSSGSVSGSGSNGGGAASGATRSATSLMMAVVLLKMLSW